MAIYIDTSAWIALHEPRDRNHEAAVARLRGLLDSQETLICGWHTLVELADGLVRHYGQKEAAAELDRLLKSPRLRVEPSEAHLERARELFRQRHGWNVDLSDCLSFALMATRKMERAFTYDGDFAKAGFRMEG